MKRFSFRPRLEQLDDRCLPSFVSAGTYETRGTYPTSLGAGDVNADGYPDIVVDSYSIYEHSPEEGGWIEYIPYRDVVVKGPNGFSGWQWDYTGQWPGWSAPDFNRDGIADQIDIRLGPWNAADRAYDGSSLRVQLGDGAGGFGVPQEVWSGSMAGAGATAADFDRDGFADLVFAQQTNWYVGAISILRNDGLWPPLPPPVPAIRIDDVTIAEGHAGTRSATFTVGLTISAAQPVTVDYATAAGTATAGTDYQSASGTLTFAPGETTKSVTFLVNGDRLGEPNESFVVNLGHSTNSYIADGQGVGTITDDEPRISISDVNKKEGKKSQTTQFSFTVTLSAAYDQPVTISFATIDGSAWTSNSDYVAKSGTLTFVPGQTTKTITIDVKGDNRREYNEWFGVELSVNSTNSLLLDGLGVGDILNDD